MMALQSALAELSKLSNDELKSLLNNDSDERYNELISQSPNIKSLESEREMLLASVRSLAEFNLSRQSEYESDRSTLMNNVSDSNHLRESINAHEAKLLELTKSTSLESTLSVLMAATSQAEEDSEAIAQQFLSNSIDHETFLSQYIEKRKLAHSRRIKAERLRQVELSEPRRS